MVFLVFGVFGHPLKIEEVNVNIHLSLQLYFYTFFYSFILGYWNIWNIWNIGTFITACHVCMLVYSYTRLGYWSHKQGDCVSPIRAIGRNIAFPLFL